MIQSIERRLRVVFSRSGPDGLDPLDGLDIPAAGPLLPMVDFVAYAEDCVLSGRVRLKAERLTDMLNEHDEVLLVDVMVERLDGGAAVEVKEVLVERDELILVHATGPRGSQSRRQRTLRHRLEVQLGPYHVRGYLHAPLGSDPLSAIRRRKPMVPLTEALVEYQQGEIRQRRRVGTVVLNRAQIDMVAKALDGHLELRA